MSPAKIEARAARDAIWIAMYREGRTLQEIGAQYGVTRERVRQRLAANGITANDGGMHIRAQARKKAVSLANRARLKAKFFSSYGLSALEVKKYASRARSHYRQQRRSAMNRGVQWSLTLAQWFDIWQASGKWDQRGRGADKYCMARISDKGAYAIGNVEIITCRKNSSDHIRALNEGRKQAKVTATTGVYLLYPGMARGWAAKFGGKTIGYFHTAAEAAAARDEYFKTHGPAVKGYSVCTKRHPKGRPFLAQIASGRTNKKLGYFATPEEARAVWLKAKQAHG